MKANSSVKLIHLARQKRLEAAEAEKVKQTQQLQQQATTEQAPQPLPPQPASPVEKQKSQDVQKKVPEPMAQAKTTAAAGPSQDQLEAGGPGSRRET